MSNNVNFALFEKYKEYLLGDYCYGLRSSEDSGSLVPSWSLVLSYEHAIRKHAYKVMATGPSPGTLTRSSCRLPI